ncbi:hypothetical protein BDR05DRAFT_997824 [Suillus weaverae]|nr:hypothetical protein BDR05DRAFT_997824 [Suillus weaverae]
MVNQPTANDTAHSDVSSSLQSIAGNTAKRVKLILPQVKATPSELHSAAPEVIDVDVDHDVDENNTAPAAEQDDEADLASGLLQQIAQRGLVLAPKDGPVIQEDVVKRLAFVGIDLTPSRQPYSIYIWCIHREICSSSLMSKSSVSLISEQVHFPVHWLASLESS